jgi:hypothetical protein
VMTGGDGDIEIKDEAGTVYNTRPQQCLAMHKSRCAQRVQPAGPCSLDRLPCLYRYKTPRPHRAVAQRRTAQAPSRQRRRSPASLWAIRESAFAQPRAPLAAAAQQAGQPRTISMIRDLA